MEFNKSMDWFKESNEDDNLLADDELDMVEEEMNEGLYVDPSNYDKHNDLIDVVDKAGNSQKMTQATYDKNKDSGEFEKKEPEKKKVKAGKKVDKNPAPKDMSSEEIQKMTQNHTKLINDSILTKEGKNAVKDSFDKTGRVYVTLKNDYGDDIRAFWRKDDDGIIRREMFSHHKPISGNDYWSRDIEDDNEYYFNDIDEFIDEMSAELEYDENMKIYV